MRPWTEQVIGTTFVTTYELGNDGKPLLFRQPKIDFVDDGSGKPVNIQMALCVTLTAGCGTAERAQTGGRRAR
jgi:hypothetical protein